jgi:hypothetical protein
MSMTREGVKALQHNTIQYLEKENSKPQNRAAFLRNLQGRESACTRLDEAGEQG